MIRRHSSTGKRTRSIAWAVSLVLLALGAGVTSRSASGETADTPPPAKATPQAPASPSNPHAGLQRRINPHAGMQFRQPTTEMEKARQAVLQKRFDDALTHLGTALGSELRDETPSSRALNECWLLLGLVHQQQGNLEEAERYYTKTIESPFFESYTKQDRFKETVLELRSKVQAAKASR